MPLQERSHPIPTIPIAYSGGLLTHRCKKHGWSMKMMVGIDGDGSGGTSPSRQGAGTETFYPPNLPFGGGGAAELFVDF